MRRLDAPLLFAGNKKSGFYHNNAHNKLASVLQPVQLHDSIYYNEFAGCIENNVDPDQLIRSQITCFYTVFKRVYIWSKPEKG